MKAWTAAIGLMGMLLGGYAHASTQNTNGSTLLHNCQLVLDMNPSSPDLNRVDTLGAGRCIGAVTGILKTLKYITDMEGMPRFICAPSGSFVSNSQALRITVKYLTDHPEQLHMEDASLIMLALTTALPCE